MQRGVMGRKKIKIRVDLDMCQGQKEVKVVEM